MGSDRHTRTPLFVLTRGERIAAAWIVGSLLVILTLSGR